MTCPQWPQMKSSPPAPNILRSVLTMERFNVVTRPICIIAIVAILPPTYGSLRHIDSSKTQINQLRWVVSHFASGRMAQNGCLRRRARWGFMRSTSYTAGASGLMALDFLQSNRDHPPRRVVVGTSLVSNSRTRKRQLNIVRQEFSSV